MKLFITLVMIACVGAMRVQQVVQSQEFRDFMIQYQKSYETEAELNRRYKIFNENLEIAANLEKINPQATFGVTKFMDLTPEEFKAQYLISNFTSQKKQGEQINVFPEEPQVDLPVTFDWRSKGAVTSVYNQGQCGSCWAFSTTENVESMWALSGHGLVQLSMQQLVDCSSAYGNEGCNGGNPPWTYPYIMSAGGLDNYNYYPYTAENGNCQFNPSQVSATISNWGYVVNKFNAEAMRNWMYQYGPPSICVDASTWQYYTGGVIGAGCGQEIDHCVQLTGWTQVQGIPVWNVRNSWGTNWGYSGYLYISRQANYCAIGDEVTSSVI